MNDRSLLAVEVNTGAQNFGPFWNEAIIYLKFKWGVA